MFQPRRAGMLWAPLSWDAPVLWSWDAPAPWSWGALALQRVLWPHAAGMLYPQSGAEGSQVGSREGMVGLWVLISTSCPSTLISSLVLLSQRWRMRRQRSASTGGSWATSPR